MLHVCITCIQCSADLTGVNPCKHAWVVRRYACKANKEQALLLCYITTKSVGEMKINICIQVIRVSCDHRQLPKKPATPFPSSNHYYLKIRVAGLHGV